MRILKLYTDEYQKQMDYSTDSPLMKCVHAKYECDEIVVDKAWSEHEVAELIRQYDVLLTMWSCPPVPDELADAPGRLQYICNITGGVANWISRKLISSPYIVVTNWGDAIAYCLAEGCFTLLLAVLKNIPHYVITAQKDLTAMDIPALSTQGSLYNKRIGIYGIGAIGRKFIDFLKPFDAHIYGYDPYAEKIPDGVTMVDSLEELFDVSQIVSIHAGLTKETRGSVTGDLLARLPDGGIIINTARGLVIEYPALQKELLSGRLRAGLDLAAEKDMPPVNDPIRSLENVILTSHNIWHGGWDVDQMSLDVIAVTCLENLERFEKGEQLQYIMTPDKYDRST